jgi:hypothetical protein
VLLLLLYYHPFNFELLSISLSIATMPPANSNESYCTFTLASDVTAGGLPSEQEIAKDLESSDDNVSTKSYHCIINKQQYHTNA